MTKYSIAIVLFGFLALTGCDNQSENTTLSASIDKSQLKTVTLKVEKMTCAACPITVRKSLENVPGVAEAKADYKTKIATVSYDPKKTTVSALTKATTDAGYPSTLIK